MERAKIASALGRLYDQRDGSILKFTNATAVFIVFIAKETQRSCGGVFTLETLTSRFAEILRESQTRVSDAANALAVKILGPAEKLASLQSLVASFNLEVRSATATAKNAEIFYYPGQGRVRVAVAALVQLDAQRGIAPGLDSMPRVPGPGQKLITTSKVSREESLLSKVPNGASRLGMAAILAQKPQAPSSKKIRVGIVDDSKTIRTLLSNILNADDVEVAWVASGPSEALKLLEKDRPDVVTLDLHMPEMNGVELLRIYIKKYPISTVIISSLSKDESPLVFDALEAGAVDYIQKPDMRDMAAIRGVILEKVKAAKDAKVILPARQKTAVTRLAASVVEQGIVVAIGASTGGTEALKEVLVQLPEKIPPILIVQHIPPVFSTAFANRLNSLCPFEVKEAQDGDEILPNRVLIAPGGLHMLVKATRTTRKVAIIDSEPVNRHKPSVDVLFDSVADTLGPMAVGVILTGMGGDGAKGLLRMKEKGAPTIAQDEASSVVFGMPREAIRIGAAEAVAALNDIPRIMMKMVSSKIRKPGLGSYPKQA